MFDHRYYQYMKCIAECQSFSKAAEKLYISQSFLSHFVKNVEDEFGITIFDRKSIPIRLTEAGTLYLKYTENFCQLENSMRADLSSISTQNHISLNIASIRLLGAYVLPKILPSFVAQHPSIDFQTSEGSIQEIIKLLDSGKTDLILTNLALDSEKYISKRLCDDPIMFAAPYNERMQKMFPNQTTSSEHPLKTDLSFLKNETLIILKNGLNMRIAAEAICQHYSLKPKRIIEASGLAAALGLVGGNKGVTFVCRSTIENIRPETPIIYFSCGSMENFTSVFAVFKKTNKNPALQDFLICASKCLSSASSV